MARKHSALCAACSAAGKAEGWEVIPYPSDATTGPGVADRLVCAEGYFIAVECKTAEYPDQTPAQKQFEKRIDRAQGYYIVVFSPEEMLEKIDKYLFRKQTELTTD